MPFQLPRPADMSISSIQERMQLSIPKRKLMATQNYIYPCFFLSHSPTHQPSLPVASHHIASQGFSNPLPVLPVHHHHHLMLPSPRRSHASPLHVEPCIGRCPWRFLPTRRARPLARAGAQLLHWVRSYGRSAKRHAHRQGAVPAPSQ